MALSKLPLNRRAPVRNRLPTLAEVKSNVVTGGRARLRISEFRRLKNERINSRFAGLTSFQRSEVPSTMECHSAWAAEASVASRWLNKVLIASRSELRGDSGIRRTSLPGLLLVGTSLAGEGWTLTSHIANPRPSEYPD